MGTCYYCDQPGDLRPYGPKSEMICFPCMKADSVREAEAEAQFSAQMESSGPRVVLDGTNRGPYPLEHYQEKDAKA